MTPIWVWVFKFLKQVLLKGMSRISGLEYILAKRCGVRVSRFMWERYVLRGSHGNRWDTSQGWCPWSHPSLTPPKNFGPREAVSQAATKTSCTCLRCYRRPSPGSPDPDLLRPQTIPQTWADRIRGARSIYTHVDLRVLSFLWHKWLWTSRGRVDPILESSLLSGESWCLCCMATHTGLLFRLSLSLRDFLTSGYTGDDNNTITEMVI